MGQFRPTAFVACCWLRPDLPISPDGSDLRREASAIPHWRLFLDTPHVSYGPELTGREPEHLNDLHQYVVYAAAMTRYGCRRTRALRSGTQLYADRPIRVDVERHSCLA